MGNIHQPAKPQALHHYLQHSYPQAHYVCACECGKSGYWIQRELEKLGIECLVVNPADIPSTHKGEVYKTDCRDARGIGDALSKGQLKRVYVPYEEQEADLHLVRQRKKIWRDLVRCKNRIKGFLDYTGTKVPSQYDNANWSRNFISDKAPK